MNSRSAIAVGARTFLSAATPAHSLAPNTTMPRKLPNLAADKNVRAPMKS
jgi:hypothetical protein